MIKSFRHKGLEQFRKTGDKSGIRPEHASKLRRMLDQLHAADRPEGMNVPGWKLHPLTGPLSGHWSVGVSGNWRLTFGFDGADAILVDYQDYH
jgi:proteic killer suppression protein